MSPKIILIQCILDCQLSIDHDEKWLIKGVQLSVISSPHSRDNGKLLKFPPCTPINTTCLKNLYTAYSQGLQMKSTFFLFISF